MNITSTKIGPTKDGNGRDTSPARYEAAVEADTTDVEAKSRRRRAADTKADDLVETLSLESCVMTWRKKEIIGEERTYTSRERH